MLRTIRAFVWMRWRVSRNAFKTRLHELGVEFDSEEDLNSAFARFKDLADKKHEIFDEDLQALVSEEGAEHANEYYKLTTLQVCSQTGEVPEANITLSVDGEEVRAQARGSGPVDAAFKAIEKIVDSGGRLQLYSVNALTGGADAQGEVTVRLEKEGRVVNGLGADTDIVIASAKSYVMAVNKLRSRCREHPQIDGAI